jgi:carboxyl-terminal processing protease
LDVRSALGTYDTISALDRGRRTRVANFIEEPDWRRDSYMFRRSCIDGGRISTAAAVFSYLATMLVHISAFAQAPPPKPAAKPAELTAAQRSKNVESFEVVWKTIRDKHFDPKLGGLDWQAIHDASRPKVEAATTMKDARARISEVIERLHQTHFGIIPAELYEGLDNPNEGPGEVGLDVRLIDGRAVVSAVSEKSPAHRAGVKTGWVVDQIDGKPVSELLTTAKAAYAHTGLVLAYQTRAVLSRLHGVVGSRISVNFLDGKDKHVHADLTTTEPVGVPAAFGNLPTFHVQFAARRVDRTVAYVSLNIFFDLVNVLKKFGEAIEASGDADGLIIDLRGNPGGIGAMAFAMSGFLVSEPGLKLGTMVTRVGSLNFTIQPRRRPFKGPVAVLVDELSMSTSEILAGGLKDLKRARIFGARTPGAALPSTVERLPNGDRFQYAFANYVSVGGKPLEGAGVVPDVETPLSRELLLEGRDRALEAALCWVHSSKKNP